MKTKENNQCRKLNVRKMFLMCEQLKSFIFPSVILLLIFFFFFFINLVLHQNFYIKTSKYFRVVGWGAWGHTVHSGNLPCVHSFSLQESVLRQSRDSRF